MANWQYFRENIATLSDLDAKLSYWGSLGWELATILHASETKRDENILAPEVWMLIFKQPVP